MNLQGATLQGGKCGALSPKDYTGLAAWWRATDGVEFYNGSNINKWKDLSGNNRHLVAYNTVTGEPSLMGGILTNTLNGVGIIGTTSPGSVFACTSDTEFKKILYDGRPVNCIIIYRIISYQTSSGFPFLYSGTNTTNFGRFVISSPTSGQTIRTYDQNNAAIAINDITLGTYLSTSGHVISVLDYGYNVDSPLLHRRSYVDGALKSEKKFTSPPSTLSDATPLTLQGGASANAIYEIIIYDNTGKTKAQIDYEHNKLYNDYIIKRYPNLFL